MSEIDKRGILDEEVFSYRLTKQGKVFIYWQGKQVLTLKDKQAQNFSSKIAGLAHKEAQLLMAKLTGNFKRGNENRF